MILPRQHSRLDDREQEQGNRQEKALIVAVIFVALLIFLLLTYLVLRHLRKHHKEPPQFLPDSLKRKWRTWQPGMYTSSPAASIPRPPRAPRRREPGQGVDRQESVRSIMTLPEYRPVHDPARERTIGREGERGGIDVVIEYPETNDEEENRREEHMQTLYEIRLARQLERAADRETGDLAGLGIRPTTSASTASSQAPPLTSASSLSSLVATLAAAHERDRRLSEVSYAEIGYARPDGSRVRASTESVDRDSLPLLDAGAPMGVGSIRGGVGRSGHGRTGSALSYSSTNLGSPERRRSDEIFHLGSARPSLDIRIPSASDGTGDAPTTTATETTAATEGEEEQKPPDYAGEEWGEPPEYSSPIEPTALTTVVPILRIETATPAPRGE